MDAVAQTPVWVMMLGWGIMLSPWVLILCWFIRRYALQKIGRCSGVSHDWLVWVPGLQLYVQGGISDIYRRRLTNKKKRKRILMPVFILARVILWIPAWKLIAEGCVQYYEIVSIGASEIAATMMLYYAILDALVYLIPFFVLGIAGLVLKYMALHDVYMLCNPERHNLYLVLSMIPGVNMVTQPLFLFLCRNQDGGMPPRREPAAENPAEL